MLEAPLKKVLFLVGAAVIIVAVAVGGGALWDYHQEPQFCAICHIMQPYLDSWNGSDLMAHTHAEAEIACLDCHEPTIGQQVQEVAKYVTRQYEIPLESPQFPKEFCLSCKEHGSYAELAERTKDYMVNGENLNPHNPHPNLEDARVEQEYDCWHCHSMHKTSRGMDYCWGCHHDGDFKDCRECH
jgi:cytochrome c nitrite reductase small subunit